ncbi:MAG: cation:proton antiporter [Candidatus Nanopelagicales bacterium]|jgi:monovalent cation:H+ antiporter-2, CPA2 family
MISISSLAALPAAANSAVDPALLMEFGLLLVVLGILARVAHRFGFSAVPFYLLGGLLLGNSPVISTDPQETFLPIVAELGVILLLLLLGLEYSGRELVDHARRQKGPGLVDLLANSLPGAAVALLFGWGLAGAIALGGVTYISSSGIVSQVVKDLRWRRNPETGPVVSILVIEDLVMAPYLPVLTVVLTGTGLIAGLISVSVALLVVGVVIVVAVRRGEWTPRIFRGAEPVGLLLVVFGLAVAAAGFAAQVSFSSAVAAFLVGLLLTGEVAEVARRRLDPLRELLAAVFFAYFGLTTDLSALPAVLLPALGLVIVTIATKFLTGWFASRTVEGGTISRLRAGALLSARGEFSVIIAGLVAVSGVLPEQFAALVAAYVLLTASIGPLLAKYAEPIGWWWDQRPSRDQRSRTLAP